MKKIKTLTIIFLLLFISINLSSQKITKQSFGNNLIINTTRYTVDLHLRTLFTEIFEFNDLYISLIYLPSNVKKSGFKLHGAVYQLSQNIYCIYVAKDLDKGQVIQLLCHEFIHIKQYETNDLKKQGLDIFYKGIAYDNKTRYNKLPFEIEAFKNQWAISRRLKKIMVNSTVYNVFY